MNDTHSLSHTKWNCKYHIVFAPKYRRKIIYRNLKAEACNDQIYMYIKTLPKYSVIGYLKEKVQ